MDILEDMNISEDIDISEDMGIEHDLLMPDVYHEMARRVPSALLPNMTVLNVSRLSQVDGKLPWLPCGLHEYNYSMARLCAAKSQVLKDRPLRFTFFGDSRARQLMGDLFLAMEHPSWMLYIKPKYNPDKPIAMTANMFRIMVDYYESNRNLTWTDRLARAEFNFTTAELRHLDDAKYYLDKRYPTPGATEEVSRENKKISNRSRKDQLLSPSKPKESPNKSTGERIVQQSETVPKNLSDSIEDAKFNPKSEISDVVHAGLIRLKFHVAVYPHTQEMEPSLPTLLETFRKYESMHPLDLPSMIIISCGMWEIQLSKREMLVGIDNGLRQFEQARPELFRHLRRWASHGVTIVWMLLDPVRDKLVKSNGQPLVDSPHPFSDSLYSWLNSILALALLPVIREGTLMMWDTGFPVSVRANDDCAKLMRYSTATDAFSSTPAWRCYDFLHAGHQSYQVYAQMVLNYACNDVMAEQLAAQTDHLCCS
ncbi:uncharacterized protein LOC108679992 isoform X2 [Hyalella azteca]|nr:uncharacterized protein LOC108679992 isoform X2 [Hyalella azteca]